MKTTFKTLSILLSLLMASLLIDAQAQLQRTAFMGVSPVTAEAGETVEVSSLHPSGTGMAIGLKVGDIVQQLNGKPVNDFSNLVELLSDTFEGALLNINVLRAGKVVKLSGAAKSRPRERGEGYNTDYNQFNWQGNQIRTITYHPDSPRKDQAAVMYIQGYTCGSIDYGMVPEVTMTQLLATYAKAGFTVFKMEKPGVGDSEGPLRCTDYDFNTENAAFIAGLNHFKSNHNISEDKLFVFGHSLGVLHAAIIAEKGLVMGVMGYGGVLKSWYEYLQAIYAEQSVRYFGVSETQARTNLETVKPFLDRWLNSDDDWQQLSQHSEVKTALQSDLLPVNGERIFDRHYSFFRSLNRYDFSTIWANSQSHALMLHGTYDIQAIDGSWASEIAALINSNNNAAATAMTFERTEHALLRYPTLEALQSAMREGTHQVGNPGDKYNPDIAIASLQWMQNILKSTKH